MIVGDRDEITALVYRYAELLDGGDIDGVVALFADATWRSAATGTVLRSPEEIRAVYERIMPDDGHAEDPAPDEQRDHRSRRGCRRGDGALATTRSSRVAMRANRSRPSSPGAMSTGTDAARTAGSSRTACSSSTFPVASRARRELQVQLLEAAEHVGGVVVVAPGVGRAVVGLGDSDVGRAIEEPLDGDLGLRARERCADARVDAVPEREVLRDRSRDRDGTRSGSRTGAGRGSPRRSSRTRWCPRGGRSPRPWSGPERAGTSPSAGSRSAAAPR